MTTRHRILVVLLLVCLTGTLAAAAARPPAALAASRVTLFRERLLLLQGYLERYANANYSYYPAQGDVRKGGALPAPLWPANPWTGSAMHAGSGTGDYVYTPATNRLSYRLVGYYPGGTIVLSRSVPYTRKMQNDHRTREQVDFIRQLIRRWAFSHSGHYPPASEVSATGSVGGLTGYAYWPHNVWTHQMIAQSTHWGDFTYTVNEARTSFKLVGHFSRGGTVTLGGTSGTSPWRRALLTLEDEIVTRNGDVLEGYVREWTLLHAGVPPSTDELAPGGAVETTQGSWPADPFSDAPMQQGAEPGQYTYVAGPGSAYTIVIHLSGSDTTITGTVPSLP